MVAISVTSGSHVRRDCFPDSRAVARQRASDFAARSPRQVPTHRAAAQGTILSTPTSVSTSTASSARSPLGIACTTVTTGVGAGSTETSETEADKRRLRGLGDRAGRRGPGSVDQHDLLADLGPADHHGVPGLGTRERDEVTHPDAGDRAEEDRQRHRGSKASLSRPNTDFWGELIRPSGDSS